MFEDKPGVNGSEAKGFGSKPAISASDYFSIKGFSVLYGVKDLDNDLAKRLGKIASKYCGEEDIEVRPIIDANFGKVNTYPAGLLYEIFDQVLNNDQHHNDL